SIFGTVSVTGSFFFCAIISWALQKRLMKNINVGFIFIINSVSVCYNFLDPVCSAFFLQCCIQIIKLRFKTTGAVYVIVCPTIDKHYFIYIINSVLSRNYTSFKKIAGCIGICIKWDQYAISICKSYYFNGINIIC